VKKVTVSDVLRVCGLKRRTFYRRRYHDHLKELNAPHPDAIDPNDQDKNDQGTSQRQPRPVTASALHKLEKARMDMIQAIETTGEKIATEFVNNLEGNERTWLRAALESRGHPNDWLRSRGF
jgi:hypothetical protein